MSNQPASAGKSGFGFKFTGKLKSKVVATQNTKFDQVKSDADDEKKDFVLSIDDNQIKSTAPEPQKKRELVIPLIVENRYRQPAKKSKTEDKQTNGEETAGGCDSLEEQAKRELLEEANNLDKEKDKNKSTLAIPLISMIIKNKVPEEYESDSKVDASLRPSEPSFEDYEKVPVEEFGLAMLRGMGWKPGDKNTQIEEPKIRLKGLGLGAEIGVGQDKPPKA